MNSFLRSRDFFRQNLFLLMGVCLTAYFSYHGIFGQRSLLALMHTQSDLQRAHIALASLQHDRHKLESKVVMLRPETLNLDYAEELVVDKLGYRKSSQVSVVGLSPDVAQQ